MIRLTPDSVELMEAKRRSDLMGLLASSRTSGRGNLVGFIGEIVAAKYLAAKIIDNYDYDLDLNGLKIDVKTKSCSSEPKPRYLCSVMSYQLDNKCDGYYFVRVNLTSNEVWLLGYVSKDRLLTDGFFAKKGETDGFFTFKEDCWSIEIKDLDESPTTRSPF